MAIVAQLYGLEMEEAMKLSQQEIQFLLESAQVAALQSQATSGNVREMIRSRLEPTTRQFRAVKARKAEVGYVDDDKVGPPNV